MLITQILTVAISVMFINNFILTRFLGLCPFFGVSKETKSAASMGAAVIFVMVCSSVLTWMLYEWVLVPLNLMYLRTIIFILVIAAFVQLVDMFLLKTNPVLHRVMGIYLPLITTNCAILGVAVLNVDMFFKGGRALPYSFILSVVQGFFGGVGFTIALLLMSGIRERLEVLEIPRSFQGVAIAFIVAALISIAFLGFSGFRL